LGRQQLKLLLGQIRRRCIERPNAGGCHGAKAGVKKQLRRITLADRNGLQTSLNIAFFQRDPAGTLGTDVFTDFT